MERVLNEARALLTRPDWNVSEIGYYLGFDEVASFNHFFKKHTAITPSAYRHKNIIDSAGKNGLL